MSQASGQEDLATDVQIRIGLTGETSGHTKSAPLIWVEVENPTPELIGTDL